MPSTARLFHGALAACALHTDLAAAASLDSMGCVTGAAGGQCAAAATAGAPSSHARGAGATAMAGHSLIQRVLISSRSRLAADADCTPEDIDPWLSGDFVDCCDGLAKKVGTWDGDGRWFFQCKPEEADPNPASTPAPTPAPTLAPTPAPTPAPPTSSGGGAVLVNMVQWNVHYTNKDTKGLASVLKSADPDILGLCELTAQPETMAAHLSAATGRTYKVQPGRAGWQGYGTDIFYDSTKWKGLEGGVEKVMCPGTSGGERAANWAVLEHRGTGKIIVTGGIHTSYCANGCDSTHQCEITKLYKNLEAMKSKYPGAAVTWMGDINRGLNTLIVQNLLQGKIGSKAVFAVDDLAQTEGNTYFAGGVAIDHIFGEQGEFVRKTGGRIPGKGKTGQHLNGADHFPVFSEVEF